MPDKLSTVLEQRSQGIKTTDTTGENKFSTTDTTVKRRGERYFEADAIYDQYSDLVNDRFRSWYCQKFYQLGGRRVAELASLARADGKNAQKYFSYLLKKNTAKAA